MPLPGTPKFLLDPNQIAGADGSTISALTDQSGQGATIAIGGSGTLTLKHNAVGTAKSIRTTGKYLTITPAAALSKQASTYLIVWGTSGRTTVLLGYGSNSLYDTANPIVAGMLTPFGITAPVSPTSEISCRIVWRRGASASKMNSDGYTPTNAGADSAGTDSSFNLFGNATYPMSSNSSDLLFAAVWDSELSDANVTAALAYVDTIVPKDYTLWTPGALQVVNMGTSISRGTGASTESLHAAALLRAAGFTQVVNRGIPSSTVSIWTTAAAAGRYDLFSGSGPRVLLCDYPTNDAGIGNAATVQSAWNTFLQARRTATSGLVVIGTTLLPRNTHNITTVTGAHNTALLSYYDAHGTIANAYVRKASASLAYLPDYLIGWHSLSGMSVYNDTGFRDGIHPNDSGYSVLQTPLQALLTLINGTTVSIDQGATASVLAGRTLSLSATHTTGVSVTWSVVSGGGTLSTASGDSTVLTAPEVGATDKTVVVRASVPGATDDISITVPAAGTGSGGAEMTINETVTKSVTPSWSEVVDGAAASIGGKSFMFGFAAKGQVIEYRVASSAPSDSDIGDRVEGSDPRNSDTVVTGKKLYVRSKDGNTFNIPIHLSA